MVSRIIKTAVATVLLLASSVVQATTRENVHLNSKALEDREPVTILISIDGFRPNYLEWGITPNLSILASSGAYGPMRPSFPTKTFPNHWTLVTGRTPDHHGIVGNVMEDSARPNEVFGRSSRDPFWWDQSEPIWITAEEQGIRSATMFWPGSEVELNGNRPSDWWPFNSELSNDRRINAVVDWMRRPADTRPRLVTLYFNTVDSAGHRFGPAQSERLNAAIAAIDTNIGELILRLEALGQSANFVIVSDHGMAETSPERIIDMDGILPREQYRLVADGNYAGIEPLTDNFEVVRDAFVRPHDSMDCWERNDIPAHFQYGKNPRVPSILCLPDTGWLVYQDIPEWMTGIGGGHGYDHRHPDMTAIFLANGPNVSAGGKLEIFDNVNIYSLVAHLAGVTPNQSDGSLEPFQSVLQ